MRPSFVQNFDALPATLVLLSGFQGEQILREPLVIVMLAVPITIEVYLNAALPGSSIGLPPLQTSLLTAFSVAISPAAIGHSRVKILRSKKDVGRPGQGRHA